MKCVAGNLAIDVRKQIFVRRDTQAGRSALPFDRESASHIDIGERADRAFICLDMAITVNSHPVAANRQNDTCREKNNRNLLHANMISLITMRRRVVLDSGNVPPSRRCNESRPAQPSFIRQSLVLRRPQKRHRRRIPRGNRQPPNHLRVARA